MMLVQNVQRNGVMAAEISSQASGASRSFSGRFLAALVLDASVFEEVEADRRALAQATAVVVLGGLARGAGAFAEEGWIGVIGSPFVGLALWLCAAAVIWAVGVRRHGYTSDYPELLRTLGFAAAPLVWLVLCALPLGIAATGLWVAVHAWGILALVVAVREALDVTTQRALAVCAIALALTLLGILAVALLLVSNGKIV